MLRSAMCLVMAFCVALASAQEPNPRPRIRTPAGSIIERPAAASRTAAAVPAAPAAPTASAAPAMPAFQPQPQPSFGPGLVPVIPTEGGARPHQRTVYRLKNAPAGNTAATLIQLFGAEGAAVPGAGAQGVVIVPDVIGNALLVGGPPDAVKEVLRLAEQLDRAAAMVVLEIVIAETPAGEPAKADAKPGAAAGELRLLRKPERMEVVSRVRLVTLDQQKASVEVGRREAMITGTSVTQFGQTNQITYNDAGTKVHVMPRVSPDGRVTLEIDVNHAYQSGGEEGTPIAITKDGKTIRSPNIENLAAKTSITLPDGQTAVLGGHARRPKPDKETLILVTPHVLRIDGDEAHSKAKP